VRDFIHVDDLAAAHVDALRYLDQGQPSQILNCGYGQGYTVRQVIERVKAISGIDFPVLEAARRAGDPACVTAAAARIRQVLGWQPRYDDLDTIVETALAWEIRRQVTPPDRQRRVLPGMVESSVLVPEFGSKDLREIARRVRRERLRAAG
jgi:UDP-glucose 4-epimerase